MLSFVRTMTAANLTAEGKKLRLRHPQSMVCQGHVTPYQMPAEEGGFITLLEFGTPNCNVCGKPKTGGCNGCGCGSGTLGSGVTQPGHQDEDCVSIPSMEGELLRYEVMAYSGYSKDGVTLNLTERSVRGWENQEWPAGTLVVEGDAEAYIGWLKGLGCILHLPKAKSCMAVKEGQWVADPTCQCWRRAKRDVVIDADEAGNLNFPAAGDPENRDWTQCFTIDDLLNKLVEQAAAPYSLKDGCTNTNLASGSAVVSKANPVAPGRIWIGGKGIGNGKTQVGPGVIVTPDLSKMQVHTGIGSNLATHDGTAVVIKKAGIYYPTMDLAMSNACNPAADPDSEYVMWMYVNGQPIAKTDLDMTGTVVKGGDASGEDTDKDVKTVVLAAGDKVTWDVKLQEGGGGHCISRMPVALEYAGCGQQTFP